MIICYISSQQNRKDIKPKFSSETLLSQRGSFPLTLSSPLQCGLWWGFWGLFGAETDNSDQLR